MWLIYLGTFALPFLCMAINSTLSGTYFKTSMYVSSSFASAACCEPGTLLQYYILNLNSSYYRQLACPPAVCSCCVLSVSRFMTLDTSWLVYLVVEKQNNPSTSYVLLVRNFDHCNACSVAQKRFDCHNLIYWSSYSRCYAWWLPALLFIMIAISGSEVWSTAENTIPAGINKRSAMVVVWRWKRGCVRGRCTVCGPVAVEDTIVAQI